MIRIEGPDISLPIKEIQKRMRSVMLRLPVIVGNEALNWVLDNFRRQGFLGDTFQPWKARKNPTKWGQTPKNNGRAILVKTGFYRRSWRIARVGEMTVSIGSNAPYARAMNYGVRIGEIHHVKSFTRKSFGGKETVVKPFTRRINQNIPARPVIGPSRYMNTKLLRIAELEIRRELKM
jgi:phage gpG-like protein